MTTNQKVAGSNPSGHASGKLPQPISQLTLAGCDIFVARKEISILEALATSEQAPLTIPHLTAGVFVCFAVPPLRKSHAAPPLFACKGAQGVLAFCQFFSSYHKKENIRIACAKMLMGRLRRVQFAALFGHAKGQRAELEPGRKSREYGGQLTGVFGFFAPFVAAPKPA